jgi:hypothetical protein
VITTDLAEDFRAYLQSGERILWTGRPALGVRFSGRDGGARFIGIEDASDVFRLAQQPGGPPS